MEIKTTSINLIATGKDGGKDVLQFGLKEAYRAKPQYQRYLQREFNRGKVLDNANIFKYIDIKETETNGLCIETEWEDSRTLAEWLQEGHSDDEKKRVIREVASTLNYMHGMGVIHGSLNTQNIFITRKGDDVKLLTITQRYADSLNQPSETLKFLAPEAKDGTVGIDARADIYSLGVMLKEMGFMMEYHNIIERCCRFGRNERFENIDAFLEAFEHRRYNRASDELTNDAPAVSSNKKMAIILAFIVVMIGVAVAFFVSEGDGDDATANQPAATEQTDTTQTAAASDADTTKNTQPATQPQGDNNGTVYQGDEAYLNDLVPQMHTDLDKIYNSGADKATIRKKVATYYKGLRRVLKRQGKTNTQLDAFDKAFAEYTNQKNQ